MPMYAISETPNTAGLLQFVTEGGLLP